MKTPFALPLFGLTALLPFSTLDAAVVVTATSAVGNHSTDNAYPSFWTENFAPGGNLLTGRTPQAIGNFAQPFGGMNLATTNDGILSPIPSSGADLSMFAGVGPGAGTRLVFDLAQASYVSSIQYFGGWVDAGRPSINFTVSYSTDNGLTYVPLIDPTGGNYSTKDDPADIQIGGMNSDGTTTFTRTLGGIGPISNYVAVTDDTSTYLGNGAAITNLAFDFGTVPNTWSGLQELTATGIAVPEPGSCALVLSGAIAFLARRKRG